MIPSDLGPDDPMTFKAHKDLRIFFQKGSFGRNRSLTKKGRYMRHRLGKESLNWATDLQKKLDLKLLKLFVADVRI